MTIADKVRRAKSDLDAVHNAGVEEGKAKGGYNEGFEDAYDSFWDAVQQNGNRTDYANAFVWWGCEDLNPKYKIVPTYGSNAARGMIYRNPNLKRLYSKDFDLSQLPNPSSASVDYTFSLCSSLEVVEDIGLPAVKTLQYSFVNNAALKQVDVIRVAKETIVKDLLRSCPELVTVNIEGTIGQTGINLQESKKLSRASIESIIRALSDEASGQSITFSKAAVDEAFSGGISADDLVTPTEEGSNTVDWFNLYLRKGNWEIILV